MLQPFYLFAILALSPSNVPAEQTAVCSATPGTGERIECTQPDTSSDEIRLTPKGLDIDTTEDDAHGVHGHHEGSGRIYIDIQTGLAEGGGLIRNDIDTTGDDARGVYGRHVGSGGIDIGGQNLHITTAGNESEGVIGFLGYHTGFPVPIDSPPEAAGNIRIVLSNSTIETAGFVSHGIVAEHHGGAGRIDITVKDSTITTLWESYTGGKGIYALRIGTTTGDVVVTVHDTNITTKGASGIGINIDHDGEDTANITIDVERGRINTAGRSSHAIRGVRSLGAGNIDIDVVGAVIDTTGDRSRGIDAYMYQNSGDIDVYAENIDLTSTGAISEGIYARFQKSTSAAAGDIFVDIRGGSIEMKGANSYGIYGRHDSDGVIDIDVRGGSIETKETNSYGIYGRHDGDGDIDIDVRGVGFEEMWVDFRKQRTASIRTADRMRVAESISPRFSP